ncbi:hypothetical protein B5P22_26900 [Pseudomonas tolaasii]|nr:hypothetical protein B5P22_26900 [Pseudomonas tolaasii]
MGKGIMSGAGGLLRAAGPAAAAYTLVDELDNKFGPTAYQNVKTMMEEARVRQAMQDDPELAERGQSTVDRIVGGAMQGVKMPTLMPMPMPTLREPGDESSASDDRISDRRSRWRWEPLL